MVMFLILGILLLVIFIILFLLSLVVRVIFEGHLYFNDINLRVKVKVLGITVLKYTIPHMAILRNPLRLSFRKKKQEPGSNKNKKDTITKENLYEIIDEADQLMDEFQGSQMASSIFKIIKIRKVYWHTIIGLGEADLSAISIGVIWAIKSQLLRWLGDHVPLPSRINIQVEPKFQALILGTDFSCMISFRLGKAIISGFRLVRQLKGRHKDVRTSDSRANENGDGKFAGND